VIIDVQRHPGNRMAFSFQDRAGELLPMRPTEAIG